MNRKRSIDDHVIEIEIKQKKRYKQIQMDKIPVTNSCTCGCRPDKTDHANALAYYDQVLLVMHRFDQIHTMGFCQLHLQASVLATLEYPCNLPIWIYTSETRENLFTAICQKILDNLESFKTTSIKTQEYVIDCLRAILKPNSKTRCPFVIRQFVTWEFVCSEVIPNYKCNLVSLLAEICLSQLKDQPPLPPATIFCKKPNLPIFGKEDEAPFLDMIQLLISSRQPMEEFLSTSAFLKNQCVFIGDPIGVLVIYWDDNYWKEDPDEIIRHKRYDLFRSYGENYQVDVSERCFFHPEYFKMKLEDVAQYSPPTEESYGMYTTQFYYFFRSMAHLEISMIIERMLFVWKAHRKCCTFELSKYLGADELVWICLSFMVYDPNFNPIPLDLGHQLSRGEDEK